VDKLLIPKDISAKRKWRTKKVLQSDLRKVYGSREEVMEMGMTEAQKEVFLAIDVWWEKYGYSPSLRNICEMRGKPGIGSTKKIVDRLVKIGAIKRVEGMGRTIRPTYISFRGME